jgi:hypothetical protein
VELAQLMPVLDKAGAGTRVKQAAVWIVTDNADYDDLGILVSSPGNTRAIGPEATALAMKICADAGIDITKKNIWRDCETIISKLPAGELKKWLKSFDKPKPEPAKTTQTPDVPKTQTNGTKTTVQVKLGSTGYLVEVSKITKGENNYPTVTIYSKAMTGSIGMNLGNMTPLVVCAVLNDETIVDPALIAGGVEGGSGYSVSSSLTTLAKKVESNSSGGSWESKGDGNKDFLTYCFITDKPIHKLLVGTYANYAKNNYKNFVSVK